MKIVHLINDTYQVVTEDETHVYFQGSKNQCVLWCIEKDVIVDYPTFQSIIR